MLSRKTDPDAIPLHGRTALVTGAASGLGLQVTRGLARQGMRVVLLDRNAAALEAAKRELGGDAEAVVLDLASQPAIRAFAARWIESGRALDILVNNAGLLPPLQRSETAEGLELGFGVSVAGHFALTGLLLPALLRSSAPRVVTTSSIAHGSGRLDFDDLGMRRDYDPNRAYANAKLAALMHALELDRRARSAGSRLLSAAAHPGIARTAIGQAWANTPPVRWRDRLAALALHVAMRWLSQSAEQGAAPLLHAACSPQAEGGAYYGPSGFAHWRGAPARTRPWARALDAAAAARLWSTLESLTNVRYQWSIGT